MPVTINITWKTRYYVPSILIIQLVMLIAYYNIKYKGIYSTKRLTNKFLKETPVGIFIKSARVLKSLRNKEYYNGEFDEKVNRQEVKGREIYVPVLGESSRHDHWKINNYNRNTFPGILNQTNIISYDSCFVIKQ